MDELLGHNSTRPTLGQGELPDSFAMRIFQTALIVDKYYTPLLFIFGTLGNSLSLLVFCMNAKYRSQSASYYLSALAISDTGFLINLLAVWLEGVHGGVITSGLMCPLVMYLGQVTCFMSVYLTVAFSIERYVAVHYPLSRPRICTRSKARRIIAALTVVALLAFSYAWVIAQVIELPSGEEPEYMYQDLSPTTNRTPVGDNLRKSFGNGKHESFSLPSSGEMLSETTAGESNAAHITLNCVNGNYTGFSNGSHHNSQTQHQPNCSYSFQDGMTLKGFPLNSTESNEESLLNGEDSWDEKSVSEDERNFLSGGGYMCTVPRDYYRISEIANYLDSVVTLIIPIFLITFFNVRIAICVWKLKDQRQSIVALSTTDINHHHGLRCSNKSSMHHKRGSNKQSSSNNTRKNLSYQQQFTTPFEETTMDNRTAKESQDIFCNAPKQSSQVRFEDAERLSQQNNGSTSSGSEGNSQADQFENEHASAGTSIQFNTKRNTPAFSGFPGKNHIMRWKTKHRPPSTRMGNPEFSITRGRRSSGQHSNAAEVRVTKTLLLVSTVFLVLNLPSHAIRCAQFIQSLRGTSEGKELLQTIQPWANILFNTNFAVNFLLYCVSGRNFRKSLRNILRKFGKRSSIIKKHGKKLEQSRLPFSSNVTGMKRNCNKEFHVTEIVELEDRVGESINPYNNTNMVNHIDDDEEEEISMSV